MHGRARPPRPSSQPAPRRGRRSPTTDWEEDSLTLQLKDSDLGREPSTKPLGPAVRPTVVGVDADEAELRRFLERAYARVLRIVSLAADSDAAAEDAVHEAIARAWERRSQIEHLDRWVLTVALNLIRSRWRRLLLRLPESSTVPSTGEEALAAAEWLMMLQTLAPRQREVAVLHYVAGLPIAEIADITRTSEGAVKNALYHARQTLAKALTAEEQKR